MVIYIIVGIVLLLAVIGGFTDCMIDKSYKMLIGSLFALLVFASLIYYEVNYSTTTIVETDFISATVEGIDVIVCESDIINLNSKLERDIEEGTVITKKVKKVEYALIGGTFSTTSYHVSK